MHVGTAPSLMQTAAMNQFRPTPDPNARLQAVLQNLFPAGVSLSYSARCPAAASLLPDEQIYTQGMVDNRRIEFTHGRHCARQAMRKLGVPPTPIHKLNDRSPAWPAGITGTIAHTGEHAAAAVARSREFVALGLDLEHTGPLEAETAKLIVRPDETADGTHAKLLFSIKESIYKCIHPVVQTYVDFQEMEVDFSGPPGTFRAIPHTNNFDTATIAGLRGRYRVGERLVASACWIRASG